MIQKLVQWLLKHRRLTADHLLHPDGSLYMERFWIFSTRFCSLRLHHICTADLDRHMHDHPWWFLSWLISGSYYEARPLTRTPCFDGESEAANVKRRKLWSLAYRAACDRHRILCVEGEVWTLIFVGPLTQWWGFYTPVGKIFWRDYPSCHATVPQTDDTN